MSIVNNRGGYQERDGVLEEGYVIDYICTPRKYIIKVISHISIVLVFDTIDNASR